MGSASVVVARRRGRRPPVMDEPTDLPRYPTPAPGCLATAPRVTFGPWPPWPPWPPPRANLQKKIKISRLAAEVGWLSPPSTPRFIFSQGLDLGVAMVAMVAIRVRSLSFPLEVQVADVSGAGKATAAGSPAHTPCTPWLGLAEGRACAEAPHRIVGRSHKARRASRSTRHHPSRVRVRCH